MSKFLLFLFPLFIFSCGEKENPKNHELTYYQHVKPILEAKCNNCHKQGGIAPFSLENYKTAYKYRKAIQESVSNKTMPPWSALPNIKAFKFDQSLNSKQIDTILNWVKAGAKEGMAENSQKGQALKLNLLDRVDITVKMDQAYTPDKNKDDDYRCFPMDWKHDKPIYIVGHHIKPDNLKVSHHTVAFLIEPPYVKSIEKFDKENEGYGYPCFGGPTVDGAKEQIPSKFLAIWAPGLEAMNFPKGSGIQIKPGSKIILQMHYSTIAGVSPDQTKIDFKTSEKVDTEGHYALWFDIDWALNKEKMKIPKGLENINHSYRDVLSESLGFSVMVGGKKFQKGINIHTLMPHMHLIGQKISSSIERADGSKEDIIKIDKWDFNWQREYVFEKPIKVNNQDKLVINCSFNNGIKSQPIVNGKRREPTDIFWGEGSVDEMCIMLMYITGQ